MEKQLRKKEVTICPFDRPYFLLGFFFKGYMNFEYFFKKMSQLFGH